MVALEPNKKNKLICIKKCDNCGKDVEIRHKKRLSAKNIFCSKECEGIFKSNKYKLDLNCVCDLCGKNFHRRPSHISKHVFCSLDCANIWKIDFYNGSGNPNYNNRGSHNKIWKSDEKITNYGYRKIRTLDHPFKDCDGFVFEHRLVAEKYLLSESDSIIINNKAYLKKELCVHHIDFNKLNNEPNNLAIMTRSEHMKLHLEIKKSKNSTNK